MFFNQKIFYLISRKQLGQVAGRAAPLDDAFTKNIKVARGCKFQTAATQSRQHDGAV